MNESLLHVDQLQCAYEHVNVVKDISFHINHGEIACLLGPSGCGKTTILRAIAGLEPLQDGRIVLDQQDISTPKYILPPEQRHIGMVFQDYALFPHLNAYDNMRFGIRKLSEAEQRARIDTLMEMADIAHLAERFPHELSGGQQQRIALVRAVAPQPKLLLLDEPFSSLDIDLRRRLSLEVRTLLQELNITALLVTHNQEEAFAMSDRVGVINAGRLEQWDTPYNLYHEPNTRFVANFIGMGQFIPGKVVSPEAIDTELGVIRGNRAYPWQENTPVEVLLRPDDVTPSANGGQTKATVVRKVFVGASMLYTLKLPTGSELQALFPSHHDHDEGDVIGIELDLDHLVAFPVTPDSQ